MSKKTISVLIKTMLVLLGIMGLISSIMLSKITEYMLPGFSPYVHRYWTGALLSCAVFCFMALVPAWLIANNIKRNLAFCNENVKYTKVIGVLLLIVSAIIFIFNTAFYIGGISFFALFIGILFIFTVFVAAAVCFFALSSLLKNATALQHQSDFTI